MYYLEMGGLTLRFTFLKNFFYEMFSKIVQAQEVAKTNYYKNFEFYSPFQIRHCQPFQLDNCGLHFWNWTFFKPNGSSFHFGDFSKTTLTWSDIFHFNFQDFLSNFQTNFKVIIEIFFSSLLIFWVFES